jgi:flagellar FliL protein
MGAGGLLVLAAIGFGLWRLHLRHTHGAAATAKALPAAKKTEKPAAPPATVEMRMDPFVVNWADPGGHSYARVGLSLSLLAPADAKPGEAKDAKDATSATDPDALRDLARDTIITVISQQQSADLLAPGGKDRLKQLLKQALTARDPRLQVADIYITEFLVQA